MKKIPELSFMIILFIFCLNFNLQKANANYFSDILSGITGKKTTGLFNFSVPKDVQIKTTTSGNQTNTSVTSQDNTGQNTSIGIGVDKNTGAMSASVNTGNTVSDKNTNTYLNSILQKLGISQTTNPNQQVVGLNSLTNPASLQNFANNPNQILSNPFLGNNANTLSNPFMGGQNSTQYPLSGLFGPLLGGSGNQMEMFSAGSAGLLNFAQSLCQQNGGTNCADARSQAQAALGQVQQQFTPYQGTGGTLPGDCGMPVGPVAYNIGGQGNNVSCDAKTIVSGYKGKLNKSKGFAAGYINPMTESGDKRAGANASTCAGGSATANQYGEGCFSSYAPGSGGAAYVQEQLLHWQQQGQTIGQKCVPVDIDNCDSIGPNNYKSILDQIEQLNNQGTVKIKVFNKNPQLKGCNFMSHPAVVGAFVESASAQEAQAIDKMRSNPGQILIFAAGSGGNNSGGRLDKLKKLESLGIKNSSYSYDSGGEYQNVNNCTYKP